MHKCFVLPHVCVAVDGVDPIYVCAGQWIDSIESEAMLPIPEEMSPFDLDLDLAMAAINSLPDLTMGQGSARSLHTPSFSAHQPVKSQRLDSQSSAALDKGPPARVTLPHLPDIQNGVQARSQVDAAADHSWLNHPSSHPQAYQAYPSQWVKAHAQPQNQQPLPQPAQPNPFKRTATQLSYGGADLSTIAQPHMAQQHLASMQPPAHLSGSRNSAQPACAASGTQGLSAQQQAVALERLQRLSADLKAANDRNARDSQAAAQTLEEERRRHKEEVQRLRDSQQVLRDELQSEKAVTVCTLSFYLFHSFH